jgi:hypothetical protein
MAFLALVALVVGLASSALMAQEKVGQRPYELVWAQRTQDAHPPLVDFESLDGWTVQAEDAQATFVRSREQQLWGQYVGKLTYRGTSGKAAVTLRPSAALALPADADCVNFWVYGNNWGWETDPSTPRVRIDLVLRDGRGAETLLAMGTVNWKEWWLMHARLTAAQQAAVRGGARLAALRFSNGTNTDDRVLYLANLSFYREMLAPLALKPQPRRGVEMFPGQSCGMNTGAGRLPFPTREETVLGDNLVADFRTALTQDGAAYVFTYVGRDGRLEYRYEPLTGTLGDVTARWENGLPFQPLAGGGVRFADRPAQAEPKAERVSCRKEGQAVVARWRFSLADRSTEVEYAFRLWQKSLVVDARCLGGQVGSFAIGKAVGLDAPRLVTLPYLVGEGASRPAVLVSGPAERPLFLTAFLDYYRSNASRLTFANQVSADGAAYNGGSIYIPKTDGRRNDCYERLFLTVSPRFEEVLPNIPNPPSPWMHVAGDRLWRAHGAGDRRRDYESWEEVARYGMTQVVITDHETGWRDGGESFTFRTRAAPGKGGDEAQAAYSRRLHALGFRYGIYNNYTDFAPVNEHWNEDRVTRTPNGDWQHAWPRCYNPKPAWAVEAEAALAPVIQEKFNLSTAYCDVHTAVTPWGYCDYDARVPGAGTFAATFYAYGQIMLHQKQTWNGPVYSEGNNHYYYCGLTDGNYGQDQAYHQAGKPWLVDFDLRKMHPLCCNFGMGSPGMFFGEGAGLGRTPAEHEANLDRFLAATVAFGHTGFLVREAGLRGTVRSYYMLQQLQARYARQKAADIRYADAAGRLLDTSAAVASGAFQRSQVAVTYADGLKVFVNGHRRESWDVGPAVLPPSGYFAQSADGRLRVYSALVNGRRADYAVSPACVFCDGRGRAVRFDQAACDQAMIGLRRDDGKVEVIPIDGPKVLAVGLGGRSASAVALDRGRKELGPAEVRFSRGLAHVMPVAGAFSYLLAPADAPPVTLTCPAQRVVPGQAIAVQGKTRRDLRVPASAKPGDVFWHVQDGAWIDFPLAPVAEVSLSVDDRLRLGVRSNLPDRAAAVAEVLGQQMAVDMLPGRETQIEIPYPLPQEDEVRQVDLKLSAGESVLHRTWWVVARRGLKTLGTLLEPDERGQCLRKGKETPAVAETGTTVGVQEMTCGRQTRRGLFMHPPWQGGVGYAFAVFGPIDLPKDMPCTFRCLIGKGDGSDRGDGIVFRVILVEESGAETVLAEKQWMEHAWTPLEGDLARWAGRKVRLRLVSDVGPADNSSGDWACWADMAVQSSRPVMVLSVHDRAVTPK